MQILRIFLILILFASAFSAKAEEINGAGDTHPDSVLAIVWLEIPGISGLAELTPTQLQKLGGLYLPRPVEQSDMLLLASRDLPPLAVQLDTRLNPAPGFVRELPDLAVLASIRDSLLLDRYIQFLSSTAHGFGIDYLVLPDVDPSWADANLLLDRLVRTDPAFFVRRNRLQEGVVLKKKDLYPVFISEQFWVLGLADIRILEAQLSKWKNLKKAPSTSLILLSETNRVKIDSLVIRDHIPRQLAFDITREAIIPLQRVSGTFPLQSDTISLITTNPAGSFATMLAKYAYLLTTLEGIAQSHSPVIIAGEVDSLPMGLETREVIFVGKLSDASPYIPLLDAALLIPFERDWNDYILPRLLFGAGNASGKLPDHIAGFQDFQNQPLIAAGNLGYMPPQLLGLDEAALNAISEIIEEAITSKSTPGCQLAVAIDGAIVLESAFGHLTYDSLIAVDRNTVYDLASVSKVTGTLLAIMKLFENGQIHLDSTLATYMPEYAQTDKSRITIRQILAHQAGLRTYIPYWKRTLKPDRISLYYPNGVRNKEGLTLTQSNEVIMDSLRYWILNTPLYPRADSLQNYRYSDIGFMILHQLVERISGTSMEQFLDTHFYEKMNLQRLTYNPMLHGFERFEIAPTEYDERFRDELIWGEVHDQNARLSGGVAGHAGLFSNAHDLLVIQQMLLQGGWYNGHQLLQPSTVAYFNHRYFENNRRGLGWDKPGGKTTNASPLVSDASYGHTGFTGSLIWSDPVYDIAFVFLSNRIYPDSRNWGLVQRDIRARIQSVIYEAILRNWVN